MTVAPTLHLIAGVNGSGKTTFYRLHLAAATPGASFVNADEFARATWPGHEAERAADAARWADTKRRELLAARETFVAETVFSHESKLDLVHAAHRHGFLVILYHVHVATPRLAVARVATRVSCGGHGVPADTVEARHERTLRLVPLAAAIADRTYVFDNSRAGSTHRLVMTMDAGRVVRLGDPLPEWVEGAYREALIRFREDPR